MKLTIENISVHGFMEAIRGMRLSWGSETDSAFRPAGYGVGLIDIGPRDTKLMYSLVKKGSSHRKFLRVIRCNMDITGPIDWWAQFDTYKVDTVRLSASTMHTLKKDIRTNTAVYHDDVEPGIIDILEVLVDNGCKISKLKKNLPCGYMLKSTVSLNYETLLLILNDRIGHKLDDWDIFCKEVLTKCEYLHQLYDQTLEF